MQGSLECRGNLKSSTFRQPAAKQIKLVFHAIKPFMLKVHYNISDLSFFYWLKTRLINTVLVANSIYFSNE